MFYIDDLELTDDLLKSVQFSEAVAFEKLLTLLAEDYLSVKRNIFY